MFVSSKYYTSRVWPFELLPASPKECSFAVWSGEGNEKHNCPLLTLVSETGLTLHLGR